MTALAFALLFSGTFALAQASDDRLMSNTDYKAFLNQIERELPTWETALKKINPENDPQTSYALGKMIVGNRDFALTEAGYARSEVVEQQQKHTVSGEFILLGFVEDIRELMGNEDEWESDGLAAHSDVGKYLPELNTLYVRIHNDVNARIALLEKGTCPYDSSGQS